MGFVVRSLLKVFKKLDLSIPDFPKARPVP